MTVQPAAPSRSAWRGLARLALILAAGIALGFALLVLAFLLPVEPMERNVLLSVPALSGDWGTGEESYEQVVKGYETTQLDNTTDAAMLLSAIHRSDTGAADRAVNVYTYHHEDYYMQYGTLLQYAKTGMDKMATTATTRYWLGFLIIVKPLLLWLTYLDIRMLNAIAQGLAILEICRLLQKRGLGRYALPFGLSLVCLTPLATGLSLQFSTAFWVMSAAMLCLLRWPNAVANRLGEAAFFLLVGMATSYFDYLTYPLVTFGMPVTLWLLGHEQDQPAKAWLRLLRCGAAWCAGYAGMWAGKWVIAALAGNETFWSSVVGSIEVRTSTAIRDAAKPITRLDALGRTLGVFAKKPYLLLALATAVGYGIAYVRARGRRRRLNLTLTLQLTVVALLPIVWFLLTANHAYSHAFYVSRALAVTAFALLCALARGCERDGAAEERRELRP